jgi:flagellar protein FlbD
MITLTRLTGAVFALNPDLVERIDENPDTVITLVDGTKYLVRESLEDVIRLIRDYRADVLATAGLVESRNSTRAGDGRWLTPVPPRRSDAAPVLDFPREDH